MTEYLSEYGYQAAAIALQRRLAEEPPGRVQLLVGPRQVGKTTLMLELAEKNGDQAIYASADAPEAALPSWADGVWRAALDRAKRRPAILLLDEIQYLPQWSRWLKSRFDEAHRRKIPLHLVATGSSSLKLGAGAKETMAGRFERLTLTHWGASDLTTLLRVSRDLAPERIVSHGGYPGAVAYWNDLQRWRTYLRDSVIEPAIGRDILPAGSRAQAGPTAATFRPGRLPSSRDSFPRKIAGSLAETGALETLAHYLELLTDAFLVAACNGTPATRFGVGALHPNCGAQQRPPGRQPLEPASPSCKATLAEWGRWLENACLAHAFNAGQEVFYWREEPWEVDA